MYETRSIEFKKMNILIDRVLLFYENSPLKPRLFLTWEYLREFTRDRLLLTKGKSFTLEYYTFKLLNRISLYQ